MDCIDEVCGTGSGNFPQPGDPSNAGGLSASPAYGGIDVTWVFPSVNPFAVAHVKLYRSKSPTFDSALDLFIVSGNTYYDKTPSGVAVNTTFYYWIQTVSVNGTIGELVGPASAVAKPLIAQTIELLSGQINDSLLAQELKTSIDKIESVNTGLLDEIKNRMAANQSLNSFLNGVQEAADAAVAFSVNETTTRIDADGALLDAINLQGVGFGQAVAGVMDHIQIMAGPESAIAKRITTVETEFGTNRTAVTTAINTVSDAVSANAALINTVQSTFDKNLATVQQKINTLANEDEAISSKIDTVQSSLGDDIASVQTKATTSINALTGKVNGLWTAKVDVNGVIGGFGLANDGKTVDAGFDVDRFWIGRSGTAKTPSSYPFIVDKDIVYIKEAAIQSLTFNKLRDESGSFVVENGKVLAKYLKVDQITGGAFTGYVWPAAGMKGFYIGPGGLLMGNANTLPGQPLRYVQITDNGDMFLPGMTFINGKMTISAIDVIDTFNIRGNSITYSGSTGGSGTTTSLSIQGHGGKCLVIVKCVLNSNGNGFLKLYVDDILQDMGTMGGGGNNIACCLVATTVFNTINGQNHSLRMEVGVTSGSFANSTNTGSTLSYMEVLK